MFPGQPLPELRDRPVHHYFDIDLEILWTTISEELPKLLESLPSTEGG